MKHYLIPLLLLGLTACQPKVPQHFVHNATARDAFDMERLALIDSAYTRMVDNGYMPHAVTMVIHHGRIVHHKAYGWRDIEHQIPCQKDDIFRMASQTKAISIVTLMTLFEEGRFQMNEPIKKYLPEFSHPVILDSYNPKTGEVKTHPASKDITIRHLITHTSGLCCDGLFDDMALKVYGIQGHNTLDSITLAEMVRRMGSLPLKHEPGEAFTYAFNTDVLARLAEVLSGKDFATLVKERVLDPLGMEDTYFYLPDEKKDRLVTLYCYPKGGPLQRVENHYQYFPYSGARMMTSASAGLCGTIEDYAKFCQMILNGGTFNGHRILGRKTLEMMQKNGVNTMRGEIGFGMAWDVFTPENAHNTIVSEGSMRWGGMFGTDYIIDPKEDLILLMYVNNMPNLSGYDPKTLLHNTAYQALK